MKNQGKKIASLLLLLSILISSLCSLSSCVMPAVETPVSIIGTEINEMGELIIRYSDSTSQNLGVVVGKDGKDGADGSNGEDGGAAAGVSVVSAKINEKGELILYYSDDTMQNLGVVVGKDGADATEPPTVNDVDVSIEITGDSESAAAAVAAAAPSVVSVLCSFPGMFGSTTTGTGSGVIYSLDKETGDALIITNYHVVYNAGKIANKIDNAIYGASY